MTIEHLKEEIDQLELEATEIDHETGEHVMSVSKFSREVALLVGEYMKGDYEQVNCTYDNVVADHEDCACDPFSMGFNRRIYDEKRLFEKLKTLK